MTTEKDARGLDLDIKALVEGHRRFGAKFAQERTFYTALSERRQTPHVLWIGCADSRVVPSQIVDAEPGELFEIRNIANCVPPSSSGDDAIGAAIEYAIGHLGVDDVVVCGHTGCGGIAALAEPIPPEREAHLGRWVELTRPAHDLVRAAQLPEADRHLATVRAHVQFQLDNLLTFSLVAERFGGGRLGLHGWVYDMANGQLTHYVAGQGLWLPVHALGA